MGQTIFEVAKQDLDNAKEAPSVLGANDDFGACNATDVAFNNPSAKGYVRVELTHADGVRTTYMSRGSLLAWAKQKGLASGKTAKQKIDFSKIPMQVAKGVITLG